MGGSPKEQELRKHRCCFTGHRPEKLTQPETEITAGLEAAIRAAINDGFVTFLSGMARGVDLWAAEIVLRLRDAGAPIHLICASPFEGFEKTWFVDWQKRYRRVWAAADYTKFICPAYSRDCFQRRNAWMVDHSARVIAAFNGERGGTKNTVDYAARRGVPVVIILKGEIVRRGRFETCPFAFLLPLPTGGPGNPAPTVSPEVRQNR